MRRPVRNMRAIIIVVCSLVFAGSSLLLVLALREYRKSRKTYAELYSFVISGEEDKQEQEPVTVLLPDVSSQSIPRVDFALLTERAPDAAAWLSQEGTVIDYPVVQGEDNDYYLRHLYDGTENAAGCLFVDCRNSSDFSDKNSIIYGHNMQDGSMFASLKNYGKQEYFREHSKMLLITPNRTFRVEIFAAFRADPAEHDTDKSPWLTCWSEDASYEEWLKEMQQRSLIKSDVVPDPGDKVLTLSTCTSERIGRFIVMGRLTEQ